MRQINSHSPAEGPSSTAQMRNRCRQQQLKMEHKISLYTVAQREVQIKRLIRIQPADTPFVEKEAAREVGLHWAAPCTSNAQGTISDHYRGR